MVAIHPHPHMTNAPTPRLPVSPQITRLRAAREEYRAELAAAAQVRKDTEALQVCVVCAVALASAPAPATARPPRAPPPRSPTPQPIALLSHPPSPTTHPPHSRNNTASLHQQLRHDALAWTTELLLQRINNAEAEGVTLRRTLEDTAERVHRRAGVRAAALTMQLGGAVVAGAAGAAAAVDAVWGVEGVRNTRGGDGGGKGEGLQQCAEAEVVGAPSSPPSHSVAAMVAAAHDAALGWLLVEPPPAEAEAAALRTGPPRPG